VRRTDPGDPEKCPVYDYHKIYTPEAELPVVIEGCTQAKIGCVDCKKILLKHMTERLTPYQDKRNELAKKPDVIRDVIAAGDAKARKIALANITKIKDAIKL
jgi:tryptophanyl-tRNA synthetase